MQAVMQHINSITNSAIIKIHSKVECSDLSESTVLIGANVVVVNTVCNSVVVVIPLVVVIPVVVIPLVVVSNSYIPLGIFPVVVIITSAVISCKKIIELNYYEIKKYNIILYWQNK